MKIQYDIYLAVLSLISDFRYKVIVLNDDCEGLLLGWYYRRKLEEASATLHDLSLLSGALAEGRNDGILSAATRLEREFRKKVKGFRGGMRYCLVCMSIESRGRPWRDDVDAYILFHAAIALAEKNDLQPLPVKPQQGESLESVS